ncbi:hypothetical protein BV25DRAFT_1912403 [Artomyces pyxidatus]|uniref:Uncharacterized protein n=1 Tax=Artomyces pyxidatus TaxID=48021 RepID=A0ACB8TF47_9AGAM|nr:hypothetical protein BV25DRAFT_1912403 [Artomyces pyxidatus]
MNSSTPLEARLNAARPPPSSPAAMRAGPGTPRRVPSAGTVPTASSSFSSAAHSTQTITPSTEKTTPSTISSLTPSVLRPPPAQPSALSRVPSAESMSISSKSTTPTPLPPSSSASLTPRKPPLVAPVDAASVSGSPALAVPAHPTFQGPPRQPAPTPSTPSPTPAILSTISTSPRPRNATAKPMSTPTPAQPPPAISIPSSSSGVIDLTLPVATLGPAFQPLPRPPSRQSSASQPSSPAPSSRSAQVYDDARAAQRNQALVQFGQKMKERAVAAEEREKALQAELAELKSLLVENEAKAHRQLAELETRARSQSLEQEENMKRQLAEYEVKAKNRLSEQEEKMKSLAEANDRLQAMQIMLTNKLKTAEAAATTRLLKLQGKAEMALTDGTEAIALSDAISSLEKHVEGLQTALRTESLGQQSASRRLKEEQEKLAKVTRELEEARGKTSTIKEMHKTVTPSTDTIDKQGLELERLCRTLEAERATRLSVEERLRTELEAHGRSVAPTGKESGDAQVEQELLALLSKELEDARQEINVSLQGRLMSARHEELQPPRKPAKLEEGEGRIPERQSRTVEDLENERRLVQDMLGMLRDEIFARQRLEMQLQEEKIKRAEDVAILHSQRRDLESARNKLEELLHEEERRLGHVLADLEEERRNGLELRELLEREAAGRRAIKDELSDARESHERAMRAIERECREPFVVPALLDAFLTISAMSDRVLSA